MRTQVDRRAPCGRLLLARIVAGVLLLVGAPWRLSAQTPSGTIVGRVTDARTGDAVPNATVQVEGTRLGAAAGVDGRYRIVNVPAGTHTLIVLRLGYASLRRTTTVAAGEDATVDITLQASAIALDQIVVTGTAGETERRSIGNAVSSIDATAELSKSAAPDMSNLLRSRAAGVDVLPVTGRIGAGPVVQIRGPSSIGLSNSPLIYIDGVRVNSAIAQGPSAAGTGALGIQGADVASRLQDINPEDVESIEVIKGPAAATIYGTEAANGVIQIITKKGSGTAAQMRAQASVGNAFFRDAEGRVPTNYDKDKAGNIVTWNGVKAMADSGHPLFKTGLERHYTTSVQGGRDQARYYAAIGYQNDYGIEPNNSQRELNAHLNLGTALGTNTDVATSINFLDLTSHLGADVGASALLGAIAGHSLLFPASFGFYPNYPPAVPQTLYDNASGVNRFTGSATVNNQLASWYTQRAVLGLDYTGEDARGIEHFAPPTLATFLSAAQAGGRIGQTLRRTTMITADYSGTAKVDLTSAFTSATSIGGQFNNSEANSSFLGGLGFPAPGVETVSATATAVAATQTQTINTTIGGYGQEQLAWRDRLFLVGALRVDNNSAFGQDFKWATYPKFSASWVMSDEPFWRWSAINTFRLRAAYGASGRQPQAFSALQTFNPVVGPGGSNAITPGQLGNPDLKPERATETEVGFESSLFGRLSLDFTYYNKNTSNEIVNQPVAPSTGFSGNQLVNLGRVVNSGLELSSTWQAVTRRSFSWLVNGNLTTIHDEIKTNITSVISSAGQSNIVGYPIQGFFSRRVVSAGRDATTGQATNVLCDNKGAAPVACAQAPFVYIGSPTPSLTGAIGNTINVGRSWRFYGLVDFKHGNLLFNQNEEIRCLGLAGAPLCEANYFPQQYSTIYLAETQGAAAALNTLDQYMQDASFLKLRELSATYTLPPRFLRLAGPGSITFAARELHTWTRYRGIDPEGAQTSSNPTSALDQAVTPPLTRFIVTLNFAW